jgi:hypothetical protein
MNNTRRIPFDFVLERLEKLDYTVKPMFGCYAIYISNKMVLMLRKKDAETIDNGVWVATKKEHHESLIKLFPSMRSVDLLGGPGAAWRIIPEDADDFEESVMGVCNLILKNDERIGKIPKGKKARKSKKKTSS